MVLKHKCLPLLNIGPSKSFQTSIAYQVSTAMVLGSDSTDLMIFCFKIMIKQSL